MTFRWETTQPAGAEMMARIDMLRDEDIIADMNAAVAHLKTANARRARRGRNCWRSLPNI